MNSEERARLIGISARKLGWVHSEWSRSHWAEPREVKHRVWMVFDNTLTDSGIVALLEWALADNWMPARFSDGRYCMIHHSRGWSREADTLADALLSAIGEEG